MIREEVGSSGPRIAPGRILKAGLAAAAIDAVYFSAIGATQGRSPGRVLQSIAGFWLGAESPGYGIWSQLLGLVTHVALATMMATGFALLRAGSAAIRRTSWSVSGVLYGLFLYAVMYLIVLPLRWPSLFPRFDGWVSVGDVGVHVAIGLAIAAIIGSHSRSVSAARTGSAESIPGEANAG